MKKSRSLSLETKDFYTKTSVIDPLFKPYQTLNFLKKNIKAEHNISCNAPRSG
jgi:hypothetical protein